MLGSLTEPTGRLPPVAGTILCSHQGFKMGSHSAGHRAEAYKDQWHAHLSVVNT